MATNYMFTVETSDVQFDWANCSQKLLFTCSIENYMGMNLDPWDEEDMLMIARELAVQVKILTALSQEW